MLHANWITIPKIEANRNQLNGKTILLPPLSRSTAPTGEIMVAIGMLQTIIDDRGNYVSDTLQS